MSIMKIYPYIKSVLIAVSLTGWGLQAQILTDFVGDWIGVENLHSPTTFYENKSISIQISEGGFKPSNANPIFKENYQRIYSTYYALSALNLLGHLDEFKKEKEWNENTITWISSQQTDNGDFFDQISPFSAKIENSFWAIAILKFLGEPLTSSKNIDVEKLIELIKVRLKNKQVESVTNSFYLMILIKSI